MASRCFRLSLALALVATACDCGEDPPPDDTFDGNVIVGDGSIPDVVTDGPSRDMGVLDADDPDDAGDAGFDDATLDAGDRCSEPSVTTLTASAALQNAALWDGMIVEITGTATRTGLSCTDTTCPPEMPCCNTCTATVTIDGMVPLSGGECFTPPPACGGSECAQTCRPPVIGIPQRFRGSLIDRGAGGVGLELFSVSN